MEKVVTLKLGGKEIKLEPTARTWRVVMEFDEQRSNLPVAKAIDEYCKVIAKAYGVEVDEVLDSLPLDEVYPTYLELLEEIIRLLNSKVIKKMEEKADETPAKN